MKFFFACALLGILFAFTLAFVNKHQKRANKLLALCFFCIACYVLDIAFINSNIFFKYPFLFNVLKPFQYLIAPTAYLYVRSLLKGNVQFRKMDSLHFAPTAAVLLVYIPFYFKPNAIKLTEIEVAIKHFEFQFLENNTVLPVSLLFVVKAAMAVSYLYLQWQLINHWKTEIRLAPNVYKDIFKWLKLFTILMSIFWIVFLIANGLGLLTEVPNKLFLVAEYLLCFSFLGMLLYLFFHPKILFGMMGNIIFYEFKPATATPSVLAVEEIFEDESVDEVTEAKVFSLTPEKINLYKQQLEALMVEQKAFLTQGCNLKDISTSLNIPKHHLSIIINSEYRMNFNDFINSYRVNYLKAKMLEPGSDKLTLDGLAREAGFNSRATFFRAFTKFTGKLPSDFLRNKA